MSTEPIAHTNMTPGSVPPPGWQPTAPPTTSRTPSTPAQGPPRLARSLGSASAIVLRVDPRAFDLGVVLLGALLIGLAAFLPAADTSAAGENSLIERGGPGLMLVIGAGLIAYCAYRRWQGSDARKDSPLAISVVTALDVVVQALLHSNRTVEWSGYSSLGTYVGAYSGHYVAPLGIAFYVAGVGLLLALVGSWRLQIAHRRTMTGAPNTQSPDSQTVIGNNAAPS